jgi:hypothetical protein
MDLSDFERVHLPFRRGERRRKPVPTWKNVPSAPENGLVQVIFPREGRFTVRGVVLLVEPEALVRWSLGNALVNAGYSVAETATLTQAIALLEKLSFDALLLDLAQPDGGTQELPQRFIDVTALSTPLILLPAGRISSRDTYSTPLGTILPQLPWLDTLLGVLERIGPIPGSPGSTTLPPKAAAREG